MSNVAETIHAVKPETGRKLSEHELEDLEYQVRCVARRDASQFNPSKYRLSIDQLADVAIPYAFDLERRSRKAACTLQIETTPDTLTTEDRKHLFWTYVLMLADEARAK